MRPRRLPAGHVLFRKGDHADEIYLLVSGKLKFVDGDAADRFAVCAAVRKDEADLKYALDRAFEDLARSGKVAKVFARWHVPYTPPAEKGGARK